MANPVAHAILGTADSPPLINNIGLGSVPFCQNNEAFDIDVGNWDNLCGLAVGDTLHFNPDVSGDFTCKQLFIKAFRVWR